MRFVFDDLLEIIVRPDIVVLFDITDAEVERITGGQEEPENYDRQNGENYDEQGISFHQTASFDSVDRLAPALGFIIRRGF